MLDINLLRDDLPGVTAGLAKRGETLDSAARANARAPGIVSAAREIRNSWRTFRNVG